LVLLASHRRPRPSPQRLCKFRFSDESKGLVTNVPQARLTLLSFSLYTQVNGV
jgi:hypothetical protein